MVQRKTQTHGVNLGGWLVLEKWMTPSPFTGLQATDEFGLSSELGPEARDILKLHRDHFITENDFQWIANHGLNAVRLPLGYWIFGGNAPYVGGIEYVDRALDWAERYGLNVILDLHGAPGSQNGRDHSGRAGVIRWHKGGNAEQTLTAIEKLCQRYAGVPALQGIELLNEPSWRLGRRRLTDYYERAYRIVREQLGDDVTVIFPDTFHPMHWKHTLPADEYPNVWFDVHFYQLFGRRDRRRTIDEQVRVALDRSKLISKLQQYHPVMVGEWSLALPEAGTLAPLDEVERRTAHQAFGAVQQFAYYDAAAWFYWSYKTENGGPWSFRDSVEKGLLPNLYA